MEKSLSVLEQIVIAYRPIKLKHGQSKPGYLFRLLMFIVNVM